MLNFLPFLKAKKRIKTIDNGSEVANLLIVSDLHLGEDLSEFGSAGLLKLISALNQKFSEFINYFAENTQAGHPWHLVFNGDAFDFLKISLRATAPTADPEWLYNTAREAQKVNIDETPAKIAEKMNSLCQAYLPLMESLVNFILAGHKITFISGNHDLELYLSDVRLAFKDFLLEKLELRFRAQKENPLSAEERDAFLAAIDFKPWFLAKPGYYHIEHGHMFDNMCSVKEPLLPLARLDPPLIATPIIQRSLPYIADLLPDFSTHGIEGLNITKLLENLTIRERYAVIKALNSAVKDLSALTETETLTQAAAKAREDFIHESPYGQPVLKALSALNQKPFELSVRQTVSNLLEDRNGPRDLRQTAEKIATITGARVVIFGHSHQAEFLTATNTSGHNYTYINSGSWVSREVEQGPKGNGATFAIITPEGSHLYKWLGPDSGENASTKLPYIELEATCALA